MKEGQAPELGSEVQIGLCLHKLKPSLWQVSPETASEGCPKQHWRASQLFSTVAGWGSELKLTSQLFFIWQRRHTIRIFPLSVETDKYIRKAIQTLGKLPHPLLEMPLSFHLV